MIWKVKFLKNKMSDKKIVKLGKAAKLVQLVFLLSLVCFLLTPQRVWAYAHEDCPICHGNRLGIGLAILTKERRLATINPSTGRPLQRIEAICLSCHSPQAGDIGYEDIADPLQEDEFETAFEEKTKGDLEGTTAVLDDMMLKPIDVGFRVINLHKTHPVGIVPRTVKLPADARGFQGQEDQLTCLGCHNHHPSNPNYKYLRWPADKGKNINKFCSNCHPDKVKPAGAKRRVKSRGREMMEFPP